MMFISARQVVAKENGSAFVPAGQPLQMGVLRWCVVITTAVFVVQMTGWCQYDIHSHGYRPGLGYHLQAGGVRLL
ncbi:hypothetical protein [Pseudomonas sp. X4]|uniref:hypothetical protein n=1 Tax=Pseudomonas sp. X4 TaxID=3231526 RepID=UPI0034608026